MVAINDNFLDAILLSGDSIATTGTNVSATSEFGEPDHAGVNAYESDIDSVWWSWLAPENGTVTINTVGSDFDTALAVYTGNQVNQLTEVASNDDAVGLSSSVAFAAIAGQTYQIAVDGFSDAQGDIVLNLNFESLAPNNEANYGFESGNLSGFSHLGNVNVVTSEFGVSPTEGNFQALLSTDATSVSDTNLEAFLGLVDGSLDDLGNGDATAGTAIRLNSLAVEVGQVLSFDWNFLTDEGTPSFFNDFGFVVIDEATTLANTNSVFVFSQSSFDEETDYQRFEYTFDTAGTYNIGFGVMDVEDTIVGSGLLLDNIRLFSEIVGTSGSDQLNGTSANERIRGRAGDDVINSNGGADVLLGENGNDRMAGSSDDDYIDGGNGRDTIFGNGGEDTLIGGNGNDTIYGGNDADTILGGAGNDTIFANGGSDVINSGTGRDTIWLGSGEATVVLDVGTGFDTINNFQLGSTTLAVSDVDALSFADSASGTRIFQGGDLLAVVAWQSASTFSDNLSSIFA